MIILQPQERRSVPIKGRYLLARSLERYVLIEDPIAGFAETAVYQSDSIDIGEARSLFVINPHSEPVSIELQTSAFKIDTNDGGSVRISGGSLDRIEESIEVTASATVENGTMHVISAAQLVEQADQAVATNATAQLLPANPNRKAALIQVISDNATAVRIGGATVSANRGAYLSGSKASPATMPIETTAAIYAHNLSGTDNAIITIVEVSK